MHPTRTSRRHHKQRPHKTKVGPYSIASTGMPDHIWEDLYHRALTMSWPRFFGTAIVIFLAFNVVFALVYQTSPGSIRDENPAGLLGAFFFSVETLSTVGYGDMHPQTLYAHVVSTVEVILGVGNIAVLTGLIFARFSRPSARILFSRNPVVCQVNGRRTLMVRTVNARRNLVARASAHLYLMQVQTSVEGTRQYGIKDLSLVLGTHPAFILGWNVMHVIDEDSPLHALEEADGKDAAEATLLLTIEGMDSTTCQPVIADYQWSLGDVRWNHRFADMVHREHDGVYVVDYTSFHDTEPVPDDGE